LSSVAAKKWSAMLQQKSLKSTSCQKRQSDAFLDFEKRKPAFPVQVKRFINTIMFKKGQA
jgi:hypothetical protein